MDNTSEEELANLSGLPEELIVEILLQLPTKTIVRCKKVCKQWRSIINKPLFSRNHFRLLKTRVDHDELPYISPRLLSKYNYSYILHLDRNLVRNITTKELLDQIVPSSTKKYYDFMTPENSKLLTTCDGIMCIHIKDMSCLCLWNPTIDEIRYVSLPGVYDTSNFNFVGFGYVSSINDYKIVLAVQPKGGRVSVMVYSLRRSEWRELDSSSYNSIEPELLTNWFTKSQRSNGIRMEAVVMNDALHWLKDSYCSTKFFLYKFDMVNERFEKVIDLSKIRNFWDDDDKLALRQVEIGVSENNRLMVYKLYSEIYSFSLPKRVVVKAWEMLDQHDYNSWRTKFIYKGEKEEVNHNHNLVQITCNGNVVIIGNKINSFKRVNTIGEELKGENVPFYALHDIPSLISPNNFY